MAKKGLRGARCSQEGKRQGREAARGYVRATWREGMFYVGTNRAKIHFIISY